MTKQGVFAGLRVLELGHYVAAPLVSQLLADQGADVLKIERPAGDPYRRVPERFVTWNRGKRSAMLDLRSAAGRQTCLELAATADVVVENFRPGVVERLGVELAALRAASPGLITCSITGFGRTGPLRDAAGWEPIVHGRAGVHVGFGEADERVWRPFPLASVAAGVLATLGIVAALLDRETSGLGQHVETSLLDAALYINGSSILGGDAPPMGVQPRRTMAGVHIYPTADGWVQVVAGTEQDATAFARLLDDHAATGVDVEADGLSPAVAAARRVMATRTTAEWEHALWELGIPAGGCGRADEWLSHPLAEASGLAVHWEESPFGTVTGVAPPLRLGDASLSPPPALGDSPAQWAEPTRFTATTPGDERSGGVLDGVTVLDLTRFLPGPLASRHLAELGATVIKVEPPGGEPGYHVPFIYLEGNRSKSSVELDLQDEAGRDKFRQLVAGADVVIENARAGVWDGLGIGEHDLRALNPHLIYARAKGFGLDGPHAGLRAFEHVLQAMTGMQRTQGGDGPPRMMTVPACDYAAPVYLAIGVLCSLLSARRGRPLPTVSGSLAVAATMYEAEHLARVGDRPGVVDDVGTDLRGPDGARHIYPVADGSVVVFAVSADEQSKLATALGVEDLDIGTVGTAVRDHSVAELLDLLTAAGVPVAPSFHPQDVSHVSDRLVTLHHPVIGTAVQVDVPFTLTRTPARVRGVAPVLDTAVAPPSFAAIRDLNANS